MLFPFDGFECCLRETFGHNLLKITTLIREKLGAFIKPSDLKAHPHKLYIITTFLMGFRAACSSYFLPFNVDH